MVMAVRVVATAMMKQIFAMVETDVFRKLPVFKYSCQDSGVLASVRPKGPRFGLSALEAAETFRLLVSFQKKDTFRQCTTVTL